MILEKGLQYSQTSLSHKDMEFYNLRKFNAKRIMQIFGMKGSVISEVKDLNRATADAERKEWWESVNIPLMSLMESAINFCFLQGTGMNLKFDKSSIDALHHGFADRVDTARKLCQIGFTANEVNERLRLGFKPKPWRDSWWVQFNMTYVDEQGREEQLVESPQQPALPEPVEEEILLLPEKGIPSERRQEVIWNRFIRRTDPIENRFHSKTKKVFYEMRKKAMRLLHQKTVNDLKGEKFEAEVLQLVNSADKFYSQAVVEGINSLEEELGSSITFDIDDPVAVEFIKKKKVRLKDVGKTITNQIDNQIALGVEAGEGVDAIAKRIKSVFNVATSRAKTIARTEVVGASNFSRWASMEAEGLKKKMWLTALDEKVRDTHKNMHGKIIKVGQKWVVGGSKLRYPGDYMGAPAEIINCRCIEVVV
jgi:SPP1 gp7 family putative phage head morphogenesis protein